jgi:KDO2-lipid IV(A) lauroyltransferase
MADRNNPLQRLLRSVSHGLEALATLAAMAVFAILPVDTASALGGRVARAIGSRLGISNRATRNLRRALPDLTDHQVEAAITGMWDNLGRVFAEYAHLNKIREHRIELVGIEHLEQVRADGVPCIFFTGHLGNWETIVLGLHKAGLRYHLVYRILNNPIIEAVMGRLRNLSTEELIPKGRNGARRIVSILKDGKRLAMLVDQKMNDGVSVPFFGRPAMTAPGLAQLSKRFGTVVIPVRLERLSGCHFRVTFHPPLEVPDSGDRTADIVTMMTHVNHMLEQWITERPEQWLWLHRRWPDS